MNRLVTLLGFRRSKSQQEDLRGSVGERRGAVRNGKYSCWEAVGPVREAWSRLGPEIKDFVENSCKYGSRVIVEIYMIGHTEDEAAPIILICSTDLAARKDIQKAIRRSGIMKNYPAIGLGDTARLPDLLAKEDIELAFLPSSTLKEEPSVLCSPSGQAFGRRFFIPRPDNDSLRLATAGPILYTNNKIYQLTVGHAFSEIDDIAPPEGQALSWDDCEFDGQSDSEDDYSSVKPQANNYGNSISKNTPYHNSNDRTGNEVCSEVQNNLSQTTRLSSAAASQRLVVPTIDLAVQDQGQTKDPVRSQRLVRVGKLALVSETGNKQSLDYALVELEGQYCNGSNELGCAPNASQRLLRVRQTAKVGPGNVNVVTMTGSSGLVGGKLCSTASYMRLQNQRTLQELYPVRLDGKLADGDCGAGVVDQLTGDLYGHIVAGSFGTGVAYIVPARQVFQDILDRLGGDVTLVRPEKPTNSKDRTSQEPLKVVEFASKEYFRQRKKPSQSAEEHSTCGESSTLASLSPTLFILPIGLQMPNLYHNQRLNIISSRLAQSNKQKRLRHLDSIDNLQSINSNIPSKLPRSIFRQKGKSREEAGLCNWNNPTLEDLFFALPSDLHVQIIASLRIPDILNLRLTSRAWHDLITANEAPIARAFIEYNPLPRFAIQLYPIPNPLEITLNYLFGLWHRFFVASKLSAAMTKWITEDMFLLKKDVERLEFEPEQARMYRRLIPLLFIIFHFFELHRQFHLKYILEHGYGLFREACPTNSIELQIMEMYDNETLLQVHQVFPHLISALTRKLRPPSHFSRIERSLRGYRKDPPPAHMHVAIFCIGGLREVARFLEIEDYEGRIDAVHDWYDSILREPVSSEAQSRGWRNWIEVMRLKQASSRGFQNDVDEMITALDDASSRSDLGNREWRQKRLSNNRTNAFSGALEAGPPMSPLRADTTQLLLSDLPVLDKIWIPTAESLLLKRQAVERKHDIKRNDQVMQELICEDITSADKLFL